MKRFLMVPICFVLPALLGISECADQAVNLGRGRGLRDLEAQDHRAFVNGSNGVMIIDYGAITGTTSNSDFYFSRDFAVKGDVLYVLERSADGLRDRLARYDVSGPNPVFETEYGFGMLPGSMWRDVDEIKLGISPYLIYASEGSAVNVVTHNGVIAKIEDPTINDDVETFAVDGTRIYVQWPNVFQAWDNATLSPRHLATLPVSGGAYDMIVHKDAVHIAQFGRIRTVDVRAADDPVASNQELRLTSTFGAGWYLDLAVNDSQEMLAVRWSGAKKHVEDFDLTRHDAPQLIGTFEGYFGALRAVGWSEEQPVIGEHRDLSDPGSVSSVRKSVLISQDGDPGPVQFQELYDTVIAVRCTPCHTSGASGGLDMSSADTAYAELLAPAETSACLGHTRVVPGDPASSLLFLKTKSLIPDDPNDNDDVCGPRMPRGSRPRLELQEMTLLEQWIADGALR